ncbi:hypothetical protein HA39_09380 [Pantoea brenneri]|nr:hypothetical protein HA39_09380 [Pantoea brenneri]
MRRRLLFKADYRLIILALQRAESANQAGRTDFTPRRTRHQFAQHRLQRLALLRRGGGRSDEWQPRRRRCFVDNVQSL